MFGWTKWKKNFDWGIFPVLSTPSFTLWFRQFLTIFAINLFLGEWRTLRCYYNITITWNNHLRHFYRFIQNFWSFHKYDMIFINLSGILTMTIVCRLYEEYPAFDIKFSAYFSSFWMIIMFQSLDRTLTSESSS